MKVKDLIEEAVSLPVEERTLLVESLLRSLNPTDAEIDKAWAAEAERRLEELRAGTVRSIPADEVFAAIRERFAG
jgi:putative addiction module component (TIGR02574 family)